MPAGGAVPVSEPAELRHDFLVVAARADTVAERRVRMAGKVRFDRLPVILVVAYLLAVGADRQDIPRAPAARALLPPACVQ